MNTDYQGRPVPEDEDVDTIIKVWQVDPHPHSHDHDTMVERSWQDMLEIVSSNLETMLERFIDDGDEEVKVTFRLVSMPKRNYLEIIDELPS